MQAWNNCSPAWMLSKKKVKTIGAFWLYGKHTGTVIFAFILLCYVSSYSWVRFFWCSKSKNLKKLSHVNVLSCSMVTMMLTLPRTKVCTNWDRAFVNMLQILSHHWYSIITIGVYKNNEIQYVLLFKPKVHTRLPL